MSYTEIKYDLCKTLTQCNILCLLSVSQVFGQKETSTNGEVQKLLWEI